MCIRDSYNNFTASVDGVSGTANCLIRGVNLDDAVQTEGVQASSLDGAYGSLTGASTISQIIRESRNYLIKSTSYTALDGEKIGVNTTSGPVTITLPGTPATGATVTLVDSHDQWGTNTCTVARNGNTINGASADLSLTSGDHVLLLFNGSGWREIRSEAVYG